MLWSPTEDAPVFRMDKAERAFLLAADAETFFLTPHYAPHALVLVRPARLDREWARARLIQTWRAMAPKRLLRAHDAGLSNGGDLAKGG